MLNFLVQALATRLLDYLFKRLNKSVDKAEDKQKRDKLDHKGRIKLAKHRMALRRTEEARQAFHPASKRVRESSPSE